MAALGHRHQLDSRHDRGHPMRWFAAGRAGVPALRVQQGSGRGLGGVGLTRRSAGQLSRLVATIVGGGRIRTLRFVFVETLVGSLDHGFNRVTHLVSRHSPRVGDVDTPVVQLQVERRQAGQHCLDLVGWALGKYHQEFVTAHPDGDIARAYRSSQAAGTFFQHRVSGGVPMLVINRFESVEIERHQRHWVAGRRRARDLFAETAFAKSPVVEAGQRIQDRQSIELVCSRTCKLAPCRELFRHSAASGSVDASGVRSLPGGSSASSRARCRPHWPMPASRHATRAPRDLAHRHGTRPSGKPKSYTSDRSATNGCVWIVSRSS